jgi:hypothetical protein
MITFKKLVAGLLSAVAMATASAMPITTTFTPVGQPLITTTNPYNFVLDINSVFNVVTDTLNSGEIVFSLTDPNAGNEQLRFVFNFSAANVNGSQVFTVTGNNNVQNGSGNISTRTVTLNTASLDNLAADGLLAVRLASTVGSYNFVNATFNGLVTLPEVPAESDVPEPFSLALMGIALAGAGVARRRKQA